MSYRPLSQTSGPDLWTCFDARSSILSLSSKPANFWRADILDGRLEIEVSWPSLGVGLHIGIADDNVFVLQSSKISFLWGNELPRGSSTLRGISSSGVRLTTVNLRNSIHRLLDYVISTWEFLIVLFDSSSFGLYDIDVGISVNIVGITQKCASLWKSVKSYRVSHPSKIIIFRLKHLWEGIIYIYNWCWFWIILSLWSDLCNCL